LSKNLIRLSFVQAIVEEKLLLDGLSHFRIIPFHVKSSQRNNFSSSRNGSIDSPPALHDSSSEESEKQNDRYGICVFGTTTANRFEAPKETNFQSVEQSLS
jgi:hypothetical protein